MHNSQGFFVSTLSQNQIEERVSQEGMRGVEWRKVHRIVHQKQTALRKSSLYSETYFKLYIFWWYKHSSLRHLFWHTIESLKCLWVCTLVSIIFWTWWFHTYLSEDCFCQLSITDSCFPHGPWDALLGDHVWSNFTCGNSWKKEVL